MTATKLRKKGDVAKAGAPTRPPGPEHVRSGIAARVAVAIRRVHHVDPGVAVGVRLADGRLFGGVQTVADPTAKRTVGRPGRILSMCHYRP
jgi:hypothetical protein